jgi:hypothetical protein
LVDRPLSPKKIAKPGESVIPKPGKKIILERIKPPKNLEAFIRYVEESFVDFSQIEHESDPQIRIVEAHPLYFDQDQTLQFCEPFIASE